MTGISARMATILSDAKAAQAATLSTGMDARVQRFAGEIARQCVLTPDPDSVTIFVFHTAVPADADSVEVDGNRIAHGTFDYMEILTHFIEIAVAYEPRCSIFVVTNPTLGLSLRTPNAQVITLDVDSRCPMYERVVAMTAFARSSLCRGPVAFLDSDAFINAPLASVFQQSFDLCFTFRNLPNVMPINEGVIFASAGSDTTVQRFFNSYLATYDTLVRDQPYWSAKYGEEYSDLRRWRGGQLSLNTVIDQSGPFDEAIQAERAGARLRFLDCKTYNFRPFEASNAVSGEELATKVIVHLKGPTKKYLAQIRQVQIDILHWRQSQA